MITEAEWLAAERLKGKLEKGTRDLVEASWDDQRLLNSFTAKCVTLIPAFIATFEELERQKAQSDRQIREIL